MEAPYDLPNGDQVRVIDTATVGQSLSRILQLFAGGATEPVFFGDEPRPQGVVISFDQWSEYETLREDAESDARRDQLVRDRLASARPEDYVPYEDMLAEWGLEEPETPGDKK